MVWLLYAAVILSCMFPVLTHKYGLSDDYTVLYFMGPQAVDVLGMAQGILGQGRPFYFLMEWGVVQFAHGIEGLAILRAVGLLATSLVAVSLYKAMIWAGWSRRDALLLPIFVVLAPAFIVFNSWSMLFVSPIAALTAVWAAMFIERSFRTGKWKVNIALAFVCLTFSLGTYQPASMLFWTVLAIFAFPALEKTRANVARAIRYCMVFAASCIPAVLFMVVPRLILGNAGFAATRRGLTPNLFAKLGWFVQGPLPEALNLHRLFPRPELAVITAVLIVVGVVLYIKRVKHQSLWWSLLIPAFILLSYFPNIVSAEEYAPTRTKCALIATLLVLLCVALRGVLSLLPKSANRLVTVAAVVAACVVVGNAHRLCYAYIAKPQAQELALVKEKFRAMDYWKSPTFDDVIDRKIPLTGERNEELFPPPKLAPGIRYEEFGCPSTSAPWAVNPMCHLLAQEIRTEMQASSTAMNANATPSKKDAGK